MASLLEVSALYPHPLPLPTGGRGTGNVPPFILGRTGALTPVSPSPLGGGVRGGGNFLERCRSRSITKEQTP